MKGMAAFAPNDRAFIAGIFDTYFLVLHKKKKTVLH
jgi:hypothetical protein